MNWVSIIALIFSGIGIGVSIWAVFESRKANQAVLDQNREKELAETEKELANINVEIARAKAETEKKTIYGVFNPQYREIKALEEKKRILLKRKQEIKG